MDTIETLLAIIIAIAVTVAVTIAGVSLAPTMMAAIPPAALLVVFLIVLGFAAIAFD